MVAGVPPALSRSEARRRSLRPQPVARSARAPAAGTADRRSAPVAVPWQDRPAGGARPALRGSRRAVGCAAYRRAAARLRPAAGARARRARPSPGRDLFEERTSLVVVRRGAGTLPQFIEETVNAVNEVDGSGAVQGTERLGSQLDEIVTSPIEAASQAGQGRACQGAFLAKQAEQHVFGPDLSVPQSVGFLGGELKDAPGLMADGDFDRNRHHGHTRVCAGGRRRTSTRGASSGTRPRPVSLTLYCGHR
jgi:hypothetical protein